jgi:tRNA nucleotidyltransferase (CCA-adding enzyme)
MRRELGLDIAMMLSGPRKGGVNSEDDPMEIPEPSALLALIASLPAGGPLLERLSDTPGVYLVGGAVRDLLLGGRPLDLDLVIEGEVDPVAGRLGGQRTVHDRFGTSTVTTAGHSYDLARARRESYSRPGALPDVEPAGLNEDLERRDFTVNAIAVALGGDQAGEVLAGPGALDDLDRRLLRVLHPSSFSDDPTRLLRLVRYWSRLGFGVEPETRRQAEAAVAAQALDTVTRTRVGNELRLLVREPDPVDALERARELGLDHAIHPQVRLRDPDLARRALSLLPDDARSDTLVLAAAASEIVPEELARLLDDMGFEARDRDVIVATAGWAEELAAQLNGATRPSEIAEAARDVPAELVALAGALGPAGPAREWLERLRTIRLELTGDDLLDAGVPQGPAVGRGLRAALAAKLDGQISSREEELATALRAAGTTG